MASRSVNKVILIGHLGRDAETKFTPGGAAVTRFSIATNRRWKDQQSGEWKEETDWVNVVLWRNESLANYLTKGKQIYVEGRIQTRSYDDKDGKKVYSTEVVADDVILLGGPDESWTYTRLNSVFRVLRTGVPLVAMQRNRWWPTAGGPSLDAGMFVAGLEYAASVTAAVVGKPSPAIYRTACELLGVRPEEAMMVGDDPESDLAPAAGIGMRTCLVRTGKGSSFSEADVDLDLPELAALPEALGGLASA